MDRECVLEIIFLNNLNRLKKVLIFACKVVVSMMSRALKMCHFDMLNVASKTKFVNSRKAFSCSSDMNAIQYHT